MIRLFDSISELRQIIVPWKLLVASCCEQNINYEPEPLLSILENLDFLDWRVVTVWRSDCLVGLFPLQNIQKLPIPVKQFSMLFQNHFMSCVPLVHTDHVDEVLTEFYLWFSNPKKPLILSLPEVLPESLIFERFLKVAFINKLSIDRSSIQTRAFLDTRSQTFDAYFKSSFSSSGRSAFRRKRKRLEEQHGPWSTEFVDSDDGRIDRFVDHLIDVESKSWKEANGSSINLNPGVGRVIKDTCHAAAEHQRFLLAVSFVGDRAVSAISSYINDGRLLIYKIGFDESVSKFSVGASTTMDLIEYAHNSSRIDIVDSCADQNLEMFNRGLTGRQSVLTYKIGSHNVRSKIAVSLVSRTRNVRIVIKETLTAT